MRKIITPEQMSLLGKNNPHQYPSVQELSDANVDNSSETAKVSGEKVGDGENLYDDIIRLSLDKDKDTVISPSKPYKSEMALRDAVTVCVRMAWR